MEERLKLPVGVDNFADIRREGFYYTDKTSLIEQLICQWGEVNLFTRPRRFGKTLNMTMLRCFFEMGTDPSLFEGLYISQNQDLCQKYMGRFPVIFLSLKSVEGLTFESARYRLAELVGREASRFSFLQESDNLTENEKNIYGAMISMREGKYTMDPDTLVSSLYHLSRLLCRHYGKQTIILIDEYDVPLDKAFQGGYYREMVSLIRSMLGMALKTNEFLYFAVLTGCLRVSKESIFTGLNNFKVLSITDARFEEQFGFTEAEVTELLGTYHLEEHLAETREWYDGYRFGRAQVYCPWDVINHVDRLCWEEGAKPQAYWINTSGNDLVKRFIHKADKTTRDEIERLVAGEAIEKPIRQELTYDEVDSSIDNLWSILFTTGYLTQVGKTDQDVYKLVIPNREVREVYRLQIREWFRERIFSDTEKLQEFWKNLEGGNTQAVVAYLEKILSNSISVFDTRAPEAEKESSYHTLLVGLLAGNANWLVKSNVEAGEGFADIIVETEDPDAGLILELKYTKSFQNLEESCRQALAQIGDRRYDEYLRNDGRENIRLYGIAFCRKRCRVISQMCRNR